MGFVTAAYCSQVLCIYFRIHSFAVDVGRGSGRGRVGRPSPSSPVASTLSGAAIWGNASQPAWGPDRLEICGMDEVSFISWPDFDRANALISFGLTADGSWNNVSFPPPVSVLALICHPLDGR